MQIIILLFQYYSEYFGFENVRKLRMNKSEGYEEILLFNGVHVVTTRISCPSPSDLQQ